MFQKIPIKQLNYKKVRIFCFKFERQCDESQANCFTGVKKSRNYDAQILYFAIFGLILVFCKNLHYCVPGYHEHSCRLHVSCSFYLDKMWCKQKNVHFAAFQGLSSIFTQRFRISPCGWAASSLLPSNSFSLLEPYSCCLTTAMETILFLIIHGCISAHEISISSKFSPLELSILHFAHSNSFK